MNTALVWLRRDLRLADNPALAEAAARAKHVVPVFVWSPDEEAPWQPGAASRWWLHHSLQALSKSFARLGSPLIIRAGSSALRELERLIGETDAQGVFWNRLYDPAIVARDAAIERALRERGLEVGTFNASLWAEPASIKNSSGAPYRVFTPFWNVLRTQLPARSLVAAPRKLTPPRKLESLDVDVLDLLPRIDWARGLRKSWRPGEQQALAAMDAFFDERVDDHRESRDRPDRVGTSRLSPHLHFGEIGPTQLAFRALRASGLGVETFLKEIGWREFAHHLLFHFPHTTLEPLDERFQRVAWRKSKADLRRWQKGETGMPIVDAGMRELWHTGWMHNRVRMIVASFLTKNLLLPWQDGARWFWDTLVDADLANNTLGWQWTAGCGADAAPYFRIFNPLTQAEKFDPEEGYVKRWVPEAIEPMVDLRASRERALEAFKALKG